MAVLYMLNAVRRERMDVPTHPRESFRENI
jgi:hypothetical protein